MFPATPKRISSFRTFN